ncbi:hypothetical protein MULP_02319 [Mycobacterium liflandii 128FXT]|uniref:Secreted protein n=1 Tax=Mycobacterium liflandii (strain 128FXT) TaxID=459424 RepID=L7V9T2_MYCL1|nr:hypothetical protein MULP_02319 [Mycobacterium liflandii 128FXT]
MRFCPKRLEITSATSSLRLAATIAGCTIAACAASNTAAAADARPAVPAAWAAAALNQLAYGAATADIAADAGPCHAPLASPAVTDDNEDAATCSSSARLPHAAAASSIDVDPAPENSRSELISGGNTEKFIASVRSRPQHLRCRPPPRTYDRYRPIHPANRAHLAGARLTCQPTASPTPASYRRWAAERDPASLRASARDRQAADPVESSNLAAKTYLATAEKYACLEEIPVSILNDERTPHTVIRMAPGQEMRLDAAPQRENYSHSAPFDMVRGPPGALVGICAANISLKRPGPCRSGALGPRSGGSRLDGVALRGAR